MGRHRLQYGKTKNLSYGFHKNLLYSFQFPSVCWSYSLCPLFKCWYFGGSVLDSLNWAFSGLAQWFPWHQQLMMGFRYVSSCPQLNSNCNHHHVVQVRKLGVILDSPLSHHPHLFSHKGLSTLHSKNGLWLSLPILCWYLNSGFIHFFFLQLSNSSFCVQLCVIQISFTYWSVWNGNMIFTPSTNILHGFLYLKDKEGIF